jgi:CheY-like chemotaxis protein
MEHRVREAVARGATEAEVRQLAVAAGMRTLAQDGLQKVKQGILALKEVALSIDWKGERDDKASTVLAAAASSEQEEAVFPERKRIVVAEDDPGVREAVCLTLEALSCEVLPAADGEEAWEYARRRLPDLIISDIQMPRLDGYGLLKRIRTNLRTAFVPVIFLTGRNRCEDRMKGYLLGGDDYIEKPFDHRELLVRARRCLERGIQPQPLSS